MSARYRCSACGNLTRFDVVERRRTRSYFHYTLGGELTVEKCDELEHEIEEVRCRWCQSSKSVVEVTVDGADSISAGGGPQA